METLSESVSIERDGLMLAAQIDRPAGVDYGPAVIIMHGLGGRLTDDLYSDLAHMLVEAGFTAVRFDFDGCGDSEGTFENMDVWTEIEDAITVFDYVKNLPYVSEVSLAGHSQGGVVASMVAGMYHDRVRALLMLAPAATLKSDAMHGTCQGQTYDPNEIPDFVPFRDGRKLGGKYFRVAQILPIYETAARFDGPARAIQGRFDETVSSKASLNYQEALPHCEATLFDGLTHTFTGPDRPIALAEGVEFLINENSAHLNR